MPIRNQVLGEAYLWRGGRGRGPSYYGGRGVPAPGPPGHDLLRDVPAALRGVPDTDLGGQ